MMRQITVERNTRETQILLTLNLDGTGVFKGSSGVGFFDHMLELFTKHGRFDLDIKVTGDTQVDYHHTVEDVGIALGQGFAKALGEGRGIKRYGSFLLPMDETLVMLALDISGRTCLTYDLPMPAQKVGSFDTELVEEFYYGIARALGLTLHIKKISGTNTHHIIEASFKAFGRALDQATSIDEKYANEIPSTKGTLI